jgi:hypothetical protein
MGGGVLRKRSLRGWHVGRGLRTKLRTRRNMGRPLGQGKVGLAVLVGRWWRVGGEVMVSIHRQRSISIRRRKHKRDAEILAAVLVEWRLMLVSEAGRISTNNAPEWGPEWMRLRFHNPFHPPPVALVLDVIVVS